MERRLYGTGARLALLVSLCMICAPSTQGRGGRVTGSVGNGRDFLVSSVDYLGPHGAATGARCCQECSTQYPATNIFSFDDRLGLCSCMKAKEGVVPTTTESARSLAGLCGPRDRSPRRRRGGRRGRGRRAGGPPTPGRCAKCQFRPVGVELDEAGWEGLGLGGTNLHECTFLDDDKCRFSFKYRYQNGQPMVWVQKNKTC